MVQSFECRAVATIHSTYGWYQHIRIAYSHDHSRYSGINSFANCRTFYTPTGSSGAFRLREMRVWTVRALSCVQRMEASENKSLVSFVRSSSHHYVHQTYLSLMVWAFYVIFPAAFVCISWIARLVWARVRMRVSVMCECVGGVAVSLFK